jgi:hypothetical protein
MDGGDLIMAANGKPGLFTRAIAAARVLGGGKVDQSDWFGPSEPLAPTAPPEVAGRRWDIATGFNLVTAPRGIDSTGSPRIGFRELRALADNYDMLRLIIETRKDQLAKLTWSVRAKDEAKRDQDDPRLKLLTDFFVYPDREHSWDAWLRAAVEDMLVIDAATIYPRKSRGGGLYALDIVDGATIKPVIDDHGRRPSPPLPAYQQVLKGLPAVDYRSDELFYFPRNYRAPFVYGCPPVEQVVMTVNIAMRRQLHQLEFYTAGTVPDMLIPVPDTWSPSQIEEFQAYFDALYTDNTAERRRARFVPGAMTKGVVQTKEAALKDEYDEWLARICCYAFSVSPQWAVKQMNRSTAETQQEQALMEGLAPLQAWVKVMIDRCLADGFGADDLEFAWDEEDSIDPTAQNELLLGQLKEGAITLDEFRAEFGRVPYPKGLGAKPLIYTATGAVTLDSVINPPEPAPAPGAIDPVTGKPTGAQVAGQPGKPPQPGADGEIERSPGRTGGKNGDAESAGRGGRMEKAARPRRPARPLSAFSQETEDILAAIWRPLLDSEGKRLAAAAQLGRKMPAAKMQKAADAPDPGAAGGAGAGQNNGDENFQLDPDAWEEAEESSRKAIEGQALRGSTERIAMLGLDDAAITALANPNAVAWAQAHAAELVSQVADTTRERVNALVTQAEDEGWAVEKLSQAIRDDDVFGVKRAQLIAHTETRTADNQGALAGMRGAQESGVDTEKSWVTRGDNVCLVCQSNEDDGWIDVGDDFNSGDDAAPAHPNCECDTEYRVKQETSP